LRDAAEVAKQIVQSASSGTAGMGTTTRALTPPLAAGVAAQQSVTFVIVSRAAASKRSTSATLVSVANAILFAFLLSLDHSLSDVDE
jgi:hypothetical protein